MADNYLERRMEEYRAGRLGSGRRVQAAAARSRREGELIEKYPVLRVLVLGGTGALGEAVVRAFRQIDSRVDFFDTGFKAGSALAQSCGARFHDFDLSDAERLDRELDIVFADRGDIDVLVNAMDTCSGRPFVQCMSRLVLHRSKAQDINPYGGRVVNIGEEYPDATDYARRLLDYGITYGSVSQDSSKPVCTPVEIAGLVRFMALPANSGIAGCRMKI